MENETNIYRKPRVIAVYSSNGGTGKTTIAVLLACKLVGQGEKVLIVDLDSQSNASRFFGVEKPSSTIADIFPEKGRENARRLDEIVVPTDCENVWIAPSDSGLRDLKTADVPDTALRDAIAGMEGEFDSVVIDCPPAAGILNENAVRAIEAGDERSTVVVPTRATATDMAATLLDLKMIGHDSPADLAGLVTSLLFVEEVLGRIEKKLFAAPYRVVTNHLGLVRPGGRVCGAEIPRVPELQEMGLPGRKPMRVDYAALSEILG